MWRKDLLFLVLCLFGGGVLLAGLLPNQRVANPERFDPARIEDADFRSVVERVNREFHEHWHNAELQPASRADDQTIVRRLSLGLTGTVPSIEEIRALEGQRAEHRIEWWVSRLLEDRRYADYTAERLARAYVGTENGPFLVYRRRRFVTWLSERLLENMPYDQLAGTLIRANGIWTSTPAVNFVSVTIDQNEDKGPDPLRLAGRTTRAFLGMRIDCLQCHDDNLGNIELGTAQQRREGTQRDFHRLAAFYSEANISLLGITDGESDYRYTFLGEEAEELVEPATPFLTHLHKTDGTRRAQLARWVTHRENKPFARAIVNRYWALLFGQPLVAPIDDIPLHGDYPPGLETLAHDLATHGFDLQRLIRIIAATDVFQLDSRAEFAVSDRHERHWSVFPLTRLRPEQIAGALIQSSSLKTIDAETHIVFRLARFGDENEFVRRYGDTGEDEFDDRGGTITQRLLMMNGDLVKGRTEQNPFTNAATKIATLAPSDDQAAEMAYMAVLGRRPTQREQSHFAQRLKQTHGDRRVQRLEDLYWVLLNSSEFSWNH